MTMASPKGFPTMSAFPRTLSSIAVSVAGLALFLILASCLLISHPIGSTVRGYFYDLDHSSKLVLPIVGSNQSTIDDGIDRNRPSESILQVPVSSSGPLVASEKEEMVDQQPAPIPVLSSGSTQKEEAATASEEAHVEIATPVINNKSANTRTGSNDASPDSYSYSKVDNVPSVTPIAAGNAIKTGSDDSAQNEEATKSSDSSNVKEVVEIVTPVLMNDSGRTGSNDASPDSSSYSKVDNLPSVTPIASDATKTGSDDSGCDLYHGHWYYDSTGPLYTNNTCPNLTQMQNCQGNGRPDKEYENWRWKPSQCDLPRFDAKKFLELMRGKTLAFIGDSVARNQMESMLCILWQVESPKNRGNRRMQRWYFRSTDVMIVRIWSSWLVHQTSEPSDFAPKGVVKLHLDAPDEGFLEFIPKFDVVVLSSGHWFAKQSVYILNNEIVGGQLWWPDNSRPQKINNIEAFGISVETILTTMVTHPNYTGLTIVRSYSPDHYEGGAWNTGGSCTGKVRPVSDGKLVENGFTNIMHEKQVTGFNRAIKKQSNKSKLRLMDITEAFSYRHDGHPGPYRSPDPNKITKRGPDGKPPPQDCLHWCMPGAVDTWNELVLEIIRREFEGNQGFSS